MAISTLPAYTNTRILTNRKPLEAGESQVPLGGGGGITRVGPTPEMLVFDLPSTVAQEADVEVYALPTQAPPALQRPVLLIHGYNGAPENWKNMRTWLTTDGVNGDGGVVDSNSTSIDKTAKVFAIKFSRPYNSTKMDAMELRQTIDKIAAATGSKEIDLVGHSKGGLDARYYLEEGNEKVKNLVMIATPNKGSALADIEMKFREMGMPIKPSVDDAEVRQCFRDLCEDRVIDGKFNNPTAHELNKNFAHQRDRANILLIAGNGTPTLNGNTILTLRGDGVVPQSSVKLDKVPLKNIWWTTHSGVKEHPDALIATANFLTGKAVDLRDQEPPGVQPDQQIVPLQISSGADQVHYLVQEKVPEKKQP